MISGGLSKAAGKEREQPPQTFNYDPFAVTLAQQGYESRVHPGTWSMTYQQLDWWSRQPIVQMPPRVMWGGMVPFCTPSQSEWEPGFQVGMRDPKAPMSRAAEVTAREITEVIMRAGGKYQWPPTGDSGGNMEAALGMVARQSFIYDQAVWEPLYTRGGKPYGWLPCDARYFRLAKPSAAEQSARQVYPDDRATFVQLNEGGAVLRTFSEDELAWFIRNPRVDIQWRGYGFPEYDEFAQVVDTVYRTFVYNDANFRNGIHANTIILFKSAMNSTQWDGVQRRMMTMMTKPNNAHRALMLQLQPGQVGIPAEDMDIKHIGHTNAEMEFTNWLRFTIQLLASAWRMDPIEFNMLNGTEGQSSSLNSGGVEQREAMSRRRWLPWTLAKFQHAFNASIVRKYDEDFAMRFTGVNSPSINDRLDMDIKSSKFSTINEIRRKHDLPDLEAAWANEVPMDPTFVQAYLQTAAQGDQSGEFAYEGAPDGEGGTTEAPLDAVMKGTNWNNVDEWTTRFATHVDARMKRKDLGAGCARWTADIA